jgi:hypothetical protein
MDQAGFTMPYRDYVTRMLRNGAPLASSAGQMAGSELLTYASL